MGTKNNPGNFDCYANAKPDEPIFVLLGRDPTAAFVLTLWRALRVEMEPDEGDIDKIEEARKCSIALHDWARVHEKDVAGALEAAQRLLGRAAIVRICGLLDSVRPNPIDLEVLPPPPPRGFAGLSYEEHAAISRKGGVAAHQAGTAHQFSASEARIAGQKGGNARHRSRGPAGKLAAMETEGSTEPAEQSTSKAIDSKQSSEL